MIKSKNLTTFWTLLLLIIFLISKEFYVMNEESLIVVTFTLFIYFTYDAISGIVTEILDERSSDIAKEFNLFFEARETALKLMIAHYSKQADVYAKMENFVAYLNSKLAMSLKEKQKYLSSIIWQQQYNKLTLLLQRENSLLREIQDNTSSKFAETVRKSFLENTHRGRLFKEIALEEAIQIVGTLSKFQLKSVELKQLLILKKLTGTSWEVLLLAYLKNQIK